MEKRSAPIAAGKMSVEERDGNKTISGYAAVFYRADSEGTEYPLWKDTLERISPGAFDRAISEKQDVRALFNHDSGMVLGRLSAGTMSLGVDDKGLRYSLPIDPQDPDHQRVAAKLNRGDITGSSFGFRVTGEEWREDGDTTIRTITDLDLIEVSPVTFPAYTDTSANTRCDEARAAFDQWRGLSRRNTKTQRLASRIQAQAIANLR